MRTVVGILLLTVGVALPMAMLFRMNSLLSRKPAPQPSRVGMLLALNGVLPIALVISGLVLLSTRFWASPLLRAVMIATWLASIVLLIALAIAKDTGRRGRGYDGG